jgi:hypothetical protein
VQDTLDVMQRSLSVQMASQMDALMSRLSDVLKPTTERLNRLERAVERLAEAVQPDGTTGASAPRDDDTNM